MLEVSSELIEKLVKIDKKLRENFSYSKNEQAFIRQNLHNETSIFRQMIRHSGNELSNWLENKEVAAVDGSVNQTKGEAPYIIYFFQALAKTITQKQYWKTDLYMPLVDEQEEEQESNKDIRPKIMSELEMKVALEMIEKEHPKVILMDGSLLHYSIDSPDVWKELREMALERNVLLVGVTEEVGTTFLKDLPIFSSSASFQRLLDRDILFGVLKQGEMLYVEAAQKKVGLRTAWLRPATSPAVVGVDILEEQFSELNRIVDFIYSTTPKEGRGIPLWLDIVDKEVRITDKLVDALVENYIASEIKQRFLQRKRTERPY